MSGTTLTPQKAELIVRILVQNGLLIVAVLVFAALGAGLVA